MTSAPAARRLVITGATGFVGTALVRTCVAAGHEVLALSGSVERAAAWHAALGAELRAAVRTIVRADDWYDHPSVRGAEALIHLAARVHVMKETALDADAAFHHANVDGTREVFAGATRAGIRRFVFVSSVKVQGEHSPNEGLTESLPVCPSDAYARSKVQAEHVVRTLSAELGLPAVIVRPPLVYGVGVGGNVEKLVAWIARGLPVPIGAPDVRRSMIGVRNLADVLLRCALDARAEGHTFLVADGDPVTIPDLVRAIGGALDRRASSVALPTTVRAALARVPALRVRLQRLSSSLVIDDRFVRRTLDWTPPYGLDEELRHMVRAAANRGIDAT